MEILGTEIDVNAPLMAAGLDSLQASEFVNMLCVHSSIDIPQTALFDHPTLKSISMYLADTAGGDKARRQNPTAADQLMTSSPSQGRVQIAQHSA